LKNGPKILAAAAAGSFLFKVFYVKRVALSLNLPTAAAAVELFSLFNKIDSHKSIKRNTVLKSREMMEGGGIITMIVAVRAHLSSCSYGSKTKTPKKNI
jgi:hypothetical protein